MAAEAVHKGEGLSSRLIILALPFQLLLDESFRLAGEESLLDSGSQCEVCDSQ